MGTLEEGSGLLDWNCLVDHVGRVRWERGGGGGEAGAPPHPHTPHTHMYIQLNE